MKFDLSKETERQKFKTRAESMLKKKSVVTLTEKRAEARVKQSAYLRLLLAWLAQETGNTPNFVKQVYFKRSCNPSVFVRHITDPYVGYTEVLKSSSYCSHEELAGAIDNFRKWSLEKFRIYLPAPHETESLERIRYETGINK